MRKSLKRLLKGDKMGDKYHSGRIAKQILDEFHEKGWNLYKPDNLEKELRARFNYKAIGEKMIIIVPENSSTSQ